MNGRNAARASIPQHERWGRLSRHAGIAVAPPKRTYARKDEIDIAKSFPTVRPEVSKGERSRPCFDTSARTVGNAVTPVGMAVAPSKRSYVRMRYWDPRRYWNPTEAGDYSAAGLHWLPRRKTTTHDGSINDDRGHDHRHRGRDGHSCSA